jgi:hypothetical protein
MCGWAVGSRMGHPAEAAFAMPRTFRHSLRTASVITLPDNLFIRNDTKSLAAAGNTAIANPHSPPTAHSQRRLGDHQRQQDRPHHPHRTAKWSPRTTGSAARRKIMSAGS